VGARRRGYLGKSFREWVAFETENREEKMATLKLGPKCKLDARLSRTHKLISDSKRDTEGKIET